MTPHQSHEGERKVGSEASESRTDLPFEYEDHSDGRHARIMKEVMAAMAWTKRQRELGFLPN